MITESNINCFLTLAETLSFTKTSQLLYFTQQGVSKNISQLEAQFGFPLFRRIGKNIELTDEGQRCYELLGGFKETFERQLLEMRGKYQLSTTTIKAGYQNFLEFTIRLNRANTAFVENNQKCSISSFRYSPGELISLLADGTLDVIVMYERYLANDSNIALEKLFTVPSVIMWSKNSERFSENTKYEDIINAPFLADMFESESMTTFLSRARGEISRSGLRPSAIVPMPNRDSAYTAAVLGEGVILGSELSPSSRADHLQKLRTGTGETVSCIWHKSNANPFIKSYAETLRDEFSNFSFN